MYDWTLIEVSLPLSQYWIFDMVGRAQNSYLFCDNAIFFYYFTMESSIYIQLVLFAQAKPI